MFSHIIRFAAAGLLLGLCVCPATARNLALMVAVTQYDEKAIRSLEGPNNDVILIWRELIRRGFKPADITVLADDLPQRDDVPRTSGSPTRAAIMAGLKSLAENARADDFVVFHYSGHGSTQPVTDPAAQIEPEPDGRDQVLLPRDAGRYDPQLRGIRNAIIDDELALALDAIRVKGATVWVIVDACHSGSVTRSGAIARSVRGSSLGVPDTAGPTFSTPTPADRSGLFAARPAPDKGPLIGFYAVDSRAEAIERAFPGFAPGMTGRSNDERVGVFTAHLIRALQAGKAETYRDLARLVSLDIGKLQGAASAPLPVFDGDLDRRIGGGERVEALRAPATARENDVAIASGSLHGYEAGAGISLYDGPVRDARALGKARITEATAGSSIATLEGTAAISTGAEIWVEVTEPAVSFTYRVARAAAISGLDTARMEKLIEAAKSGAGRRSLAVDFVGADAAADLRLTAEQGRLWFVPDGQPLITDANRPGTSISLDLGAQDAALASGLRRVVWSMARAANLVRIASASAEGGADAQLFADIEVQRETDPAKLADEKRACTALSKPSSPQKLTPAVAAAVGHCDEFSVTLKNTGDRAMDVAVLYVDSRAGVGLLDDRTVNNGCIVTLPSAMSEPMRIPQRQFAIWEDGKPQTLGLERILIFAIPRTGSSPPSLCHLREPTIEAAARTATRSAAPSRGFAKLLAQAGLADGSVRSANPAFGGDDAAEAGVVVRQFAFDIRTREWP